MKGLPKTHLGPGEGATGGPLCLITRHLESVVYLLLPNVDPDSINQHYAMGDPITVHL